MRSGRFRLALQLFLLAVLVTAVCAWTALALVRATFERQLRGELESMATGAGLALDEEGSRLAAALVEIEVHLRERESGLLEQLLHGGMESADAAALIMPLFSLDALDIIDGDGRVVSSGGWPERVGLQAVSELTASQVGEPDLGLIGDAEQVRLGLLCKHEMTIGSRSLLLVGGRRLDERILERIAGREAALLIWKADEAPIASTLGARLDLRELRERLKSGGAYDPELRVRDIDGGRWSARLFPLGIDASIVLAVNHERLELLLERMRNAFILLGLVVGLAAALAGLWAARIVSRPVDDLIRAFDAMAAGEADYTFPVTREHELQELIASVSRLHRSLELQQQRSIAAERVAAWSDVARLVAHEVKNPLAPIRLTAENLLRARREAPERFDEMFNDGMRTIMEEVEQLSRLVAEFSEFARLPQPARRPENLERILSSAVELYSVEPDIKIERRHAGAFPRIELDADQISMAIKNVLGNAVEASREGESSYPMTIVVSSALEGGMAKIVIEDSGPGFSEETERRLFEPYYTTKGGGTGLGMALTSRVIIEHGGLISAENRAGGGARVSIFLPLGEAAEGADELRSDS
jgi:signal transduction histidine kinase